MPRLIEVPLLGVNVSCGALVPPLPMRIGPTPVVEDPGIAVIVKAVTGAFTAVPAEPAGVVVKIREPPTPVPLLWLPAIVQLTPAWFDVPPASIPWQVRIWATAAAAVSTLAKPSCKVAAAALVKFPPVPIAREVVLSSPVDGLKVNLVLVTFSGRFPVFAVTQTGNMVALVVVSSVMAAAAEEVAVMTPEPDGVIEQPVEHTMVAIVLVPEEIWENGVRDWIEPP